jgi:hypothetical protein
VYLAGFIAVALRFRNAGLALIWPAAALFLCVFVLVAWDLSESARD